ncbi:hypothetical protein [Streptomyces incarnatus]|uniref:hypothetical protein n=1 Tax=Streptomyces incarnatus TaxID=665007 RepID=UPI000B0387F4|nr:hypothetical protein [Streptomyces incarnatus]
MPRGGVDHAGPPTRKDPFRGSPVQRWAEGADAIEVPAAKAVGGMSRQDVALALRRTKEFLVGTNLDSAVLPGGQSDAAPALLDPRQPTHCPTCGARCAPRTGPTTPWKAAGTRGLPLRLPAGPGRRKGRPRCRGTDDHRRDLTTVLLDPHEWIATEGKLNVRSSDSEFYNSERGGYDGCYHPIFPDLKQNVGGIVAGTGCFLATFAVAATVLVVGLRVRWR